MEQLIGLQSVSLIGGYHPLTIRIIERIKNGVPGDIIEDTELAALIRQPVDNGTKGYSYIYSATRYVERVHSIVWRRVPCQGKIRCLNPVERIEFSRAVVKQIGKKSKRTVNILVTLRQDEIPDGSRSACNALAAQLGFIATISTQKASKMIESKTVVEQPKLEEALKLFE
jgi:hypothetical protein